MIIGIDLDGVVYNIIDMWLEEYNKLTGDDIKTSNLKSPGIHKFTKLNPNESSKLLYSEQILKNDIILNCPEYPNSISTIKNLMCNHHIMFISNTFMFNREARVKRLIQDFGIPEYPNNYDIIFTSKKERIKCDMFVDDFIINVKTYKTHNKNSIVYIITRPWNKDFNNIPYKIKREKELCYIS